MAVHGILSALFVGLVIGGLARLVLRGRQHLPLWLTVVIGATGALVGTALASLLGVADTPGIDWIELALQVAAAAVGIDLVTRGRGRSRVRR